MAPPFLYSHSGRLQSGWFNLPTGSTYPGLPYWWYHYFLREPWLWPNYNNKDCKCAKTYMGPKNSKSNEGRQAKNGGVKERDGSAEELNRETGEEQITVGWTERMADDRLPKIAAELREQGRRRRGRPRLRWENCVKRYVKKAGEEGDWNEGRRQRRVEKTSRWGGEKVAGSTSPQIKGKRESRGLSLKSVRKFN